MCTGAGPFETSVCHALKIVCVSAPWTLSATGTPLLLKKVVTSTVPAPVNVMSNGQTPERTCTSLTGKDSTVGGSASAPTGKTSTAPTATATKRLKTTVRLRGTPHLLSARGVDSVTRYYGSGAVRFKTRTDRAAIWWLVCLGRRGSA